VTVTVGSGTSGSGGDIPQGAHRFLEVVVGRRDGCHHERFRVAAQRVLQEPGQLRVAIRDVLPLAVHQRRNHVPERGQRQVDLAALLQAVACNQLAPYAQ